jgi:uncharacterized protein (UPF0248 family)/transposase
MELVMSQKERDRMKVIDQVAQGKLRQRQAAALVGLSERQVRRIVQRYQLEGDVGLVHRSRGRASNRTIPGQVREEAVRRVRECYSDFGPTLAGETLAERDGIAVSRETLRGWMIAEGIWKARARRVTHRQWRARRECVGELVQMDTSIHDWFEGRGEQAVLINMVDDATSRVFARFFPADTTEANMRMLMAYLRRYGRPVAIYADGASHFLTTRTATTLEEQLEGRQPETQIGRALRELSIESITAHSPQAKGRVERSFGTSQDRLIKKMRLANVCTIDEANAFLEGYLPEHNAKYAVAPACSHNAHRSIRGLDLSAILSRQETRVVGNDYTFQYDRQRYQIEPKGVRTGLRKARVTVQQRLDGSLRVCWRGKCLPAHRIPPPRPTVRPTAPAPPRPPHKPAPDHPWRRDRNRTFLRGQKADTSTLR